MFAMALIARSSIIIGRAGVISRACSITRFSGIGGIVSPSSSQIMSMTTTVKSPVQDLDNSLIVTKSCAQVFSIWIIITCYNCYNLYWLSIWHDMPTVSRRLMSCEGKLATPIYSSALPWRGAAAPASRYAVNDILYADRQVRSH